MPEQLFVALDRERVDRGLAPFAGLTAALDADAQKGAGTAELPPRPGRDYAAVGAEWIGAVDNGLDADYQWMYDDGPNSGVPNCSNTQTSGCWADRQIVLQRFGSRHLVMGAAFDATGDTSPGDRGGSSLAATLAVDTQPGPLRLLVERRARRHQDRHPAAAAHPPRLRVQRRRRRPRPATCNRTPTTPASAPTTGSTTRPPASTPRWPPSTTRTRSRASGPWCCRPGSPSSASPTSSSSR